jgi:hypothetical protein
MGRLRLTPFIRSGADRLNTLMDLIEVEIRSHTL